jgi:hypothetical protein
LTYNQIDPCNYKVDIKLALWDDLNRVNWYKRLNETNIEWCHYKIEDESGGRGGGVKLK